MLRPPRALEELWYEALREQGFEDIEDVSRGDRPLKSWQSWQFIEESRSQRRVRNEEYQELIDSFSHRTDFDEICALVIRPQGKGTKGGRPPLFLLEHVRLVWELHCEGITERQIALRLTRSKTAIHKLLERLRVWMKLV